MNEVSDDHDDILLTKAVRVRLQHEKKRTGITAITLLDGRIDKPRGLTAGTVNRWINGLIASASREHFDYVLACWGEWPDLDARAVGRYPTAASSWIAVTDEIAAELRNELARTGVDHATMLEGLADVPSGLTARIIKGWLYQHAKTTRAVHWEFVLEHLKRLDATPGWIRQTRR